MTGVRTRDDRVQISYYWHGKRVYETLPPGTTLRQAGKIRTERLHAINTGTFAEPSAITVAALLAAYGKEMAAGNRSAALRRWHHNACRWLVPAIGHIKVRDLTPQDVAKARDVMLERLAAKTAREYVSKMAIAVDWAIRQGLVVRNVVRLVDLPQAARHEVQPLSQDEARRLLTVLQAADTPYARMLALGLLTALRTASEWGGMRCVDIDLAHATASLTQVALNEPGGVQLAPAGNSKSKRRLIELSARALALVREQLARSDASARLVFGVDMAMPDVASLAAYREWQRTGLLFCNHLLEPIPRSTLTKYWKGYLAQAGLPSTVRIHDLRHTCATLMLAAGEHPKVVQEQLGHSTIAQTMNTYSHVVPGMQRAATERLEALLATGGEIAQ